MTKLLSILTLSLLFTACKPDPELPDTVPANDDYFIFGTSYGECYGDCAHFFKLENGKLFADDSASYLLTYDLNHLNFQTQSLPVLKIAIAENLQTQIPAGLQNEQNGTLGCPDCHDQGNFVVKVKKAGVEHFWVIDPDLPQYAQFCHDMATAVYSIEH